MNPKITPVLLLIVLAISAALFLRGGEVLTALAVSTTNSTITLLNTSGVEPGCTNITCYDSDNDQTWIKLVGGEQRYVRCEANCWDFNAWSTVKNVTGQLTTGGPGDCSASNVDCYVNATCWNTTVNSTHANVRCGYWFWYNADNTSKYNTWQGRIIAGDVSGLKSTAVYDGINVSELIALGSDSSLAFGDKNAGSNDSTTTTALTIYNYGNVQMDFKANGSTMTCTFGSINAQYIRGNLTNGGFFQASYGLTSTLSGPNTGGKFDANFNENTTATTQVPRAPTLSTYWGIGLPSAISGSCQGITWQVGVLS